MVTTVPQVSLDFATMNNISSDKIWDADNHNERDNSNNDNCENRCIVLTILQLMLLLFMMLRIIIIPIIVIIIIITLINTIFIIIFFIIIPSLYFVIVILITVTTKYIKYNPSHDNVTITNAINTCTLTVLVWLWVLVIITKAIKRHGAITGTWSESGCHHSAFSTSIVSPKSDWRGGHCSEEEYLAISLFRREINSSF